MSTVRTNNDIKFSDEMIESLKEADEIIKNPDDYPSYNSVKDLIEALNEKCQVFSR